MRGLWKYDAIVVVGLGLAVAASHVKKPAEEVEAAAAAGEAVAQVIARPGDPSPPPSFRTDCLAKGRELMAWRSDTEPFWKYDCPAVRIGR